MRLSQKSCVMLTCSWSASLQSQRCLDPDQKHVGMTGSFAFETPHREVKKL